MMHIAGWIGIVILYSISGWMARQAWREWREGRVIERDIMLALESAKREYDKQREGE